MVTVPRHIEEGSEREGPDGFPSGEIYPVWPLRSEDDYLRAVEVVDKLAIKGEEDLTEGEQDQLDIFIALMEVYENMHHPMDLPKLPPVEFLKKLLDFSGMSESDLGRLLGERSLGHKILKGERQLSKAHIKRLSGYFKVDAGAFL
jgi:HTH-type transcriptional regulator/antitoxin HigA